MSVSGLSSSAREIVKQRLKDEIREAGGMTVAEAMDAMQRIAFDVRREGLDRPPVTKIPAWIHVTKEELADTEVLEEVDRQIREDIERLRGISAGA